MKYLNSKKSYSTEYFILSLLREVFADYEMNMQWRILVGNQDCCVLLL